MCVFASIVPLFCWPKWSMDTTVVCGPLVSARLRFDQLDRVMCGRAWFSAISPIASW